MSSISGTEECFKVLTPTGKLHNVGKKLLRDKDGKRHASYERYVLLSDKKAEHVYFL